jgi:hypothetical protein
VDWLEFWNYGSATWAGLQFAALVVAAAFAFYEANQARKLRQAQAEPFVVADLEVSDDQKIHIVIENLGTTMAENVKLAFDPELRSSLEGKRDIIFPLRETKAFTDGIPSLPPGRRFRAFFDVFYSRNRDVFPDVYKVSITYDAPALGKKNLKRTTVLDLGIYWNLIIMQPAPGA